jgi:glycerol-3-phosphate dehydrogenase (NAD(P)+)
VTVQEGVHSAESVAALAERHGIDMPIVRAVDAVLNHDASIDDEIARLLARTYHFERVVWRREI